MGIILFLLDTSASMSQRTFLGTTLIDIGKGAVETFIKVRPKILQIFYISIVSFEIHSN